MKKLKALFIYICCIFIGGALISPWIYKIVQQLAQNVTWISSMANEPFHRYVHRSLIFIAIIGVFPIMRALNLNGLKDLGLRLGEKGIDMLATTFVIGSVLVFTLGLILISLEVWVIRRILSIKDVAILLCTASATGLTVALIEETLFRGLFLKILIELIGKYPGIIFSSLLYAWTHFFLPVSWMAPVKWDSGFQVLALMFEGWIDPFTIWPAAINLTILGCVLAMLYLRTGNLGASIGLHAGLVAAVKMVNYVFKPLYSYSTVYGTKKLVDGWIALPIMILIALLALGISFQKELPNKDATTAPEAEKENRP